VTARVTFSPWNRWLGQRYHISVSVFYPTSPSRLLGMFLSLSTSHSDHSFTLIAGFCQDRPIHLAIPPPIARPSGHPPMQCTILSNPRASPTNSLQHIRTHHPGLVPHTPLVHPRPLPVILSTQMAACLITCSPFTTTRAPSRTIPLHRQMEVSPSTSLDKPSALGRAHQAAPRVRSLHPIGSSSYSSARCVFISSHRRLVLRE
jgi:hypothetical protein